MLEQLILIFFSPFLFFRWSGVINSFTARLHKLLAASFNHDYISDRLKGIQEGTVFAFPNREYVVYLFNIYAFKCIDYILRMVWTVNNYFILL